MKQLTALFFAISLSLPAWGGGDLPFPLENQNPPPAVADLNWTVDATSLSLQIKVFIDPTGKPWAKLWVRQSDGFVWASKWMEPKSSASRAEIMVDDVPGYVLFDWRRPENTQLVLGGHVMKLATAVH